MSIPFNDIKRGELFYTDLSPYGFGLRYRDGALIWPPDNYVGLKCSLKRAIFLVGKSFYIISIPSRSPCIGIFIGGELETTSKTELEERADREEISEREALIRPGIIPISTLRHLHDISSFWEWEDEYDITQW
jgi:hypothetical protein